MNVKSFCNSYVIYIKSKLQYYKPYKSLKQLLILKWLCRFHQNLFFLSGYNIILVIVNQLFKQTIFVSTVDIITLHKLAKLFVIHIFFKHDISFHITSDYRSDFVLNFSQSLGTALDILIYFISRYYSKRDSQIKYTNQIC